MKSSLSRLATTPVPALRALLPAGALVLGVLGTSTPAHSRPIAISPNDKLIIAANSDDDSVSVIRPDNNTRITNIQVGDEPRSLAITPDGGFVYVANAAGSSVSVIKINNPAWETFNATVVSTITTGAEPWNVIASPDGKRVFVANSSQGTISILNTANQTIIGHIDLRHDPRINPPFSRNFQPRGLAMTADNKHLYVSQFLSFAKTGGRQGDDLGKEGTVAVLDTDTSSTSLAGYQPKGVIHLAPQVTGFRFPGLADDTVAFPNQLQSIVIRGDRAYLPNIAASPAGPLRFNLDTQAFVNVLGDVNSTNPTDLGGLNLHLGARDPEPGKTKLFFANPWDIAFTTQSGAGNAYVVSAASDLLVKLNVSAAGDLGFTVDADTTRYIDLNSTNPITSGRSAGKNPVGLVITSDGTRAYVANEISRNVSVVDLTTDTVIASVPTTDLPAPGSQAETVQVGAEMFFSSRGSFNPVPGFGGVLQNRLSSDGWQSCSSCHPGGMSDGVVWQFASGPRKTVPLNSTFNPQSPHEQRLLNYSAIFDEVEDFEINIRNVSGPGPLPGNLLDPAHGLVIGDNGDPASAPTLLNGFNFPNANRPQLTVTLPGSNTKVTALTALREWVRSAVRTPNATLKNLPGAHPSAYIADGRILFGLAACNACHGGPNWTVSQKDFTSPPSPTEIFTERSPVPVTGNPVGTQFLDRFLFDVGTFNLGVPGQNNLFLGNIGADEKAPPTVVNGVVEPGQDALGRDYNNDGRGAGFNVPSLLGIHASPPFFHNGAAESLLDLLGHPSHRTGGGLFPDGLNDPSNQIRLFAFIDNIDATTRPFLPPSIRLNGSEVIISFDTISGVSTDLLSRDQIGGSTHVVQHLVGDGERHDVPVPVTGLTQFFQILEQP